MHLLREIVPIVQQRGDGILAPFEYEVIPVRQQQEVRTLDGPLACLVKAISLLNDITVVFALPGADSRAGLPPRFVFRVE